MIVLIAIAFAAAIGLAVVTVSSAVAQRQVSRRSLSAIDGYQLQATVREQEMVEGVGPRVIAPIGAATFREALELFFECASPAEIQERLGGEVFVTQLEVAVG